MAYYKHRIMPAEFPGIDLGDDLAGFLSLYGAERTHGYASIGVAEKFRQHIQRVKAKHGTKDKDGNEIVTLDSDGNLTPEAIAEICAWNPSDMELPREPHEDVVDALAGLNEEQRTKALQKLKDRLAKTEAQ